MTLIVAAYLIGGDCRPGIWGIIAYIRQHEKGEIQDEDI
jgi:hypothetical protein